jgi:hypothetical protein
MPIALGDAGSIQIVSKYQWGDENPVLAGNIGWRYKLFDTVVTGIGIVLGSDAAKAFRGSSPKRALVTFTGNRRISVYTNLDGQDLTVRLYGLSTTDFTRDATGKILTYGDATIKAETVQVAIGDNPPQTIATSNARVRIEFRSRL